MSHHCHAVGCERRCPPAMFMCGPHWRKVPKENQREVWRTYRPGQEIDKRPTSEYMQVTNEARRIVAEKEGKLELWEIETKGYERTIELLKEVGR